jgi:hypothetical protein
MTNILHKFKQEFLKVLPPTIFFFFTFNIIAITSVLMLRGRGLEVSSILGATVLALVVGKVVLIVDHTPFVNKFPDKPLIYNIVWKSFIYVIAVLLARYIEHLIPFLKEGGGFMAAHRHLMEEVNWARFLAIQIWFMVLFFFYTVLVELIRVLGKERVVKMFFGRG